jgi:hypothetical protein
VLPYIVDGTDINQRIVRKKQTYKNKTKQLSKKKKQQQKKNKPPKKKPKEVPWNTSNQVEPPVDPC